jgi:hypothetical protein
VVLGAAVGSSLAVLGSLRVGLDVESGDDSGVVGGGGGSGVGVLVHGWQGCGGDDADGGDVGGVDESVGGEDVVDELAAASEDAGVVGAVGGQEAVEVPEPVAVTAVGGLESGAGSEVDL